MKFASSILALVVGLSVLDAAAAGAQPLGTFTWQLQPFCNTVTVSVTQNGGIYTSMATTISAAPCSGRRWWGWRHSTPTGPSGSV